MNSAKQSGGKIILSIIIINYNLADEIEHCLKSFLNKISSSYEHEYEIIIVDNNSPDKKLSAIERKFKKDNINFYYLNDNLGFGKGCNYGFSKASGKYICFLNPDTIVKEDIFTPIISLFESNETIGIIGPRQQVREPYFDFSAGFYPNILFELFNLIGAGVFFEAFLVNTYIKLSKKSMLKMDWILGAAIFIRAEIFELINGFDKDYFMFSEEVDLCKRVSNKGYKIIYYPELKIHHIGSVSGKKDYTLYTIRTYSSKYIYISKHYKSIYKLVMKIFLYIQLFSQIVIWILLFPLNKEKSKQKIRAFTYLLKHKMKYEHRN